MDKILNKKLLPVTSIVKTTKISTKMDIILLFLLLVTLMCLCDGIRVQRSQDRRSEPNQQHSSYPGYNRQYLSRTHTDLQGQRSKGYFEDQSQIAKGRIFTQVHTNQNQPTDQVHYGHDNHLNQGNSKGHLGKITESNYDHEEPGLKQSNQRRVINKGQGYQNQGHASNSGQGQGAPQCMYNFVVNELDSSKCPMLFQQPAQQPQPQQFVQNDEEILTKYYENLNMNKDFDNLVKRIDALDNKLLREVARNRELEHDILNLENLLKKTESKVNYHEQNITNMGTVVKKGEIMQQKQMGYWKNVDEKLSGIMLDVVELNNRLDRQDSIMNMNDEASKNIAVESTGLKTCSGIQNATKYKDCEDLYHSGHKRSGVYYITPIYSICSIPVYCDMDTPPGGWLLIQRRFDGSVSFNRTWSEYRHGFGYVGGEFWLGNDNLFLLTNQLHYTLRVDLYDFYNSRVYAEYKTFKIDGERDRFMLHISNHSGTAPDGFTNHNKVKFSTPDQDHDDWLDYHCAKEWAAGWWYNNCWYVILNGQYYNTTDVKYRGISWNEWKSEQLKRVEMKIHPAGF